MTAGKEEQPPNYKTKLITDFLGRKDVRVLSQNENGPCPLLAIANVLSLRGELHLPPDEIPHSNLLALVASAVLDASSRVTSSSITDDANLRHNVEDCLETLEKLGRPGSSGMDVNLKFNSPSGFEPTREIAVFDLLGISLVHGWLVDPQDVPTAQALGSSTYNQAVERIISALDGGSSSQAASRHASFVASRQGTLARMLPTSPNAKAQQHQQGDLLGLDETAPQQQADAAAPPTPDLLGDLLGGEAQAPVPAAAQGQAAMKEQQKEGEDTANMFEGLSLKEDAPGATQGPAAQSPSKDLAGGSKGAVQALLDLGTGDERMAQRVHQALLVREFLEGNASQLTVYGISQIASQLPENQLAVFFRNNHFNVLFKHGRSLYLLVTDQGYLGVREVVWERLDTVDGDTQLCGPDFLPHKARAQVPVATQAAVNMQALAAIPPEALVGLSEADAAAIAEAAGVLLPPAHESAPAAQHGAAQQPHASEDADLALAMLLQQEEEDRHARELEEQQQQQRRRQQQEQQRAALAQQQQLQQRLQQSSHVQHGYQTLPQQEQQRVPARQQAVAGRATGPPAAQESKKDSSSCAIM